MHSVFVRFSSLLKFLIACHKNSNLCSLALVGGKQRIWVAGTKKAKQILWKDMQPLIWEPHQAHRGLESFPRSYGWKSWTQTIIICCTVIQHKLQPKALTVTKNGRFVPWFSLELIKLGFHSFFLLDQKSTNSRILLDNIGWAKRLGCIGLFHPNMSSIDSLLIIRRSRVQSDH